jgi:ribosomal-protein-alanine N-acetyltransferase
MQMLTARLRLRPLSWADLEALVALYSDPEVMLGSSGAAVARSPQESAEWLDRALATSVAVVGHETFRVEDRSNGVFLGRCGLRPDPNCIDTELAYAFARSAWGRGIATEAAQATIEWGAEAGLTCVLGYALASNRASQRVLEKVGMIRVGEKPTPVGSLFLYQANLAPALATHPTLAQGNHRLHQAQ